MATIVEHIHTPPPRPSTRTELPVPPALDDLVLACLAKDPAERPQGARELRRRLGEIAASSGAWTEADARAWWRTHRPGVAA